MVSRIGFSHMPNPSRMPRRAQNCTKSKISNFGNPSLPPCPKILCPSVPSIHPPTAVFAADHSGAQSADFFFKKNGSTKKNYLLLTFNLTFFIQILLGVLMTFYNIPWHLALAHQGNAIILFLISISMWMFSKKSLQSNLT